MKKTFFIIAFVLVCSSWAHRPVQAGTITFGSGANSFTMTFVRIGNPNNPADTTGYPNPAGSVGIKYDFGKYEVSRDMINKYNNIYGISHGLVITMSSLPNLGALGDQAPATGVSWNEAARFVNWMNTSQGYSPAYKFANGNVNSNISLWNPSDTLDYDPTNPYRSKRAFFALPSSNEWYKAAYYDPNKGSGGYWDYATGSDTPPISVTGGTLAGSSVYRLFYAQGPAVVTQAAGLSPYGIMGMNGNVAEWEETASDLVNDSPSETRGFRGGAWFDGDPYLSSSFRNCALPEFEHEMIGFRVWSQDPPNGAVPEPTSIAIGSLFGLGTYLARKRKRREM